MHSKIMPHTLFCAWPTAAQRSYGAGFLLMRASYSRPGLERRLPKLRQVRQLSEQLFSEGGVLLVTRLPPLAAHHISHAFLVWLSAKV